MFDLGVRMGMEWWFGHGMGITALTHVRLFCHWGWLASAMLRFKKNKVISLSCGKVFELWKSF